MLLFSPKSQLAVCNALRYFPSHLHHVLAAEFAQELRDYGHIYMYRFRPVVEMRAYPISEYPAKCRQAAAIMHMVMNNLDPRVAQVSNNTTMMYLLWPPQLRHKSAYRMDVAISS